MGRWRRLVATGVSVAIVLAVGAGADAQLFKPKAKVTSPGGPGIEEAQREAYDGPKARVAVARFDDKTGKGWWTGQIGDGMADMLATALFQTSRYIVLERQTLGDILQEQDLATAGRIKRGTEAPTGVIEGAELLITGAVTEFEPGASGVRGGLGGVGGKVGRILGGIAGGLKKAHMAIDIRVVDTATSRLVAATSVEGEATDVDLGGVLAGAGSGGALAGALSGWSKTPIEKALRICLQEAVRFITTKTPQVYYRHGAQAAVAAAPPATGGGPQLAAAPPSATGAVPAPQAITSVRADLDHAVILDLTEAKVRGSVLSVVVSLRRVGSEKESELLRLAPEQSGVLDYETGEMFPAITFDGFTEGRLQPGEVKTLRGMFKVPKGAKAVAITLSGIGTFDDVQLRN